MSHISCYNAMSIGHRTEMLLLFCLLFFVEICFPKSYLGKSSWILYFLLFWPNSIVNFYFQSRLRRRDTPRNLRMHQSLASRLRRKAKDTPRIQMSSGNKAPTISSLELARVLSGTISGAGNASTVASVANVALVASRCKYQILDSIFFYFYCICFANLGSYGNDYIQCV